MADRQCRELFAPLNEEHIGANHQRARLQLF
jgi:hypothetical protein